MTIGSHTLSLSTTDDDDTTTMSRQYCQGLAAKLASVTDLPASCKKYPDVVKTLQRRTTTGSASDATVAFQGMRAGSAAAARAARAKGQEHHAQIQRRYTTSRK
jgi:hypothetical protein